MAAKQAAVSAKAGTAQADANPAELSSAAKTMAARTKIMRAVYGGTETMREMDREFLPQYEKESNTRYQARLASTFALNKLREAVDAASAKPFKTLIKVTNTTPELDLMIKDVDLQGNHLHIFAHQFFNNAMLDGQCHFLVDHPTTTDMPSLAAQKESGVRPFFRLIRDDQLIAAYEEYAGGDTQVVHCRLRSQRVVRDASYKETLINQIWVIEKDIGDPNGVVMLYEQAAGAGGGQWDLVSETTVPMLEVPLVTMYAGDKESSYVTRPVFMDLAYKQIEHWISSSDQRSILAAARFPMLAASGVQLDEDDESGFAIGPYKVLYSPEAQGRWYYVEPKGSAIESGLKDLEMLEMQMDMMALNPVTGTHRQYVPQNERDIQETRVHSVVHDMALSCRDALKRGLQFAGNWTSKDYSQCEVGLNIDFSNTKDKLAEIKLLLDAWEKRGVSRETFLKEARARDLVGDDFDVQAELAALAAIDQQEAGNQSGDPPNGGTPAAPKPKLTHDFEGGGTRPKPQI